MILRRYFFLGLSSPNLILFCKSHQKVSVEWSPKDPKVYETVYLKFLNLPAKSIVRLETTLTTPAENLNFLSSCFFPVDCNGTLDLSTTPCNGPSYSGVDPMGIFWSMDPQPGSLTRLYSSGPLHYAINIFDMNNNNLFSQAITRNIYDKTVSRLDIRTEGIIGTLFTPAGPGPFPTVVVIDGSARIKEDLAASVAMKGFVVLSLAYFKGEGLPPDYSHVKLEYFEKAIEFLQGQACVQVGGVGLLGLSKGCDLSLSCASFLPVTKVRAVATVNGSITSAAGITTYGDNTVKKHGLR